MSAAESDPVVDPAAPDVSQAPEVPDAPHDGTVVVPDEAVRLALELAFGVAVLGARQRPPLPVPAGLRPFLRFQKLPPAALGPLRRAVEADETFRSRVAAVADESVVGRAGALWLRRPEGWRAELAARVPAGDAAAEARRQREEAVRVERAERAAARAAAEAAVLGEALAAERERQAAELASAHARVEATVAELAARVEAAEKAAAAAAVAREVAERRLVDAERSRAAADRQAAHLAERMAAVEAERDELRRRAEAAERAAAEAQAMAAPGVDPPVAGAPASDLARRLAPLVGDAAAAVGELGRVLARLGRELDADGSGGGPARRPGAPSVGGVAPHAPPPPRPAVRSVPVPAGPARTPVPLPPRVPADAAEAATFLLRRPGALVLVDGYNVAKVAFPAASSLADERDWLADVLDELAARTCADLRVVFDGAGVPPVPSRRRAVQVLFSPAGVTADDVLVDLVRTTPVERPVVLVTNDLALRERAKVYGANVLGSDQLLAAARR